MQIYIEFTCRECGQDIRLHTDTSNYGVLLFDSNTVEQAQVLELHCTCDHVSGKLGLGYRLLPQHRPSHER